MILCTNACLIECSKGRQQLTIVEVRVVRGMQTQIGSMEIFPFVRIIGAIILRGEARKEGHRCQHEQVALMDPFKNKVELIYLSKCILHTD